MAITASAPDAFFDAEDWSFDIDVNQADGTAPLNLTGSRLFVRFVAPDGTVVGVCDSAAADGSIVIAPGTAGLVTILVSSAERTWRIPRLSIYSATRTVAVFGDLYRYPSLNSTSPVGICRITLDVLASTGLPA